MTERLKWLRERQKGIGGSDAPALVLSPEQYKWKRPEDVLADKVYPIEDEGEERLCCRIGHELEDFAARLFTEVTGLKVRKDSRHFVHPAHPFMVGNIDRKIVGHNWGLECKTTARRDSGFVNAFTEDSYPLEYFVQIQHYLAVTGWEKWWLSVILLCGSRHLVYQVPRDEEFIRLLTEKETAFWAEVLEKRKETKFNGYE